MTMDKQGGKANSEEKKNEGKQISDIRGVCTCRRAETAPNLSLLSSYNNLKNEDHFTHTRVGIEFSINVIHRNRIERPAATGIKARSARESSWRHRVAEEKNDLSPHSSVFSISRVVNLDGGGGGGGGPLPHSKFHERRKTVNTSTAEK